MVDYFKTWQRLRKKFRDGDSVNQTIRGNKMTSKTRKVEALKHQIARLQEEARIIEGWSDSVRSLDSFTPEEKIKVFDALYEQAREYLRSYVEDGWEPKDGKHYLYEAVLSQTLGENVWGIIRSI